MLPERQELEPSIFELESYYLLKGALGECSFHLRWEVWPIGSGKQWMSWISMDDHIAAVQHLMMTKNCEGMYI